MSDSSALTTLNRLFQAGNVNLRSNTSTRQTPLMMAASNASRDVVALLLEHGAQVNMQDTSGNTALMFALESGDLSVISLLLDCPDLDLTLRDNVSLRYFSLRKLFCISTLLISSSSFFFVSTIGRTRCFVDREIKGELCSREYD